MTPSNEMCPICSYAGSAQYCEWPSPEQIRQGVVPLDSLPAAWWNNMWADATNRINEARDMIGQVITEINNVLENAGICAASACTDQLYQSINKIRQVLATDSIPGSVVSSSSGGAVCVANDGTMSVNCLGNVAALTTSAHTVVGAVNELKSTYDCCINDLQTCTSTLDSGKAPVNHASADTTYGVGNASCYGHVKLSDTYDSCIGAAADSIAASQKALYDMYTCITSAGYVTLGNTVGCALGTASAGTATTAARSDHVHPTLTCVECAGKNGSGCAFGAAAICGIRVGGSVGYVPYSGADGCPLLTSNFLAYWNGAYTSSGASNLKYFCGGAFGTAAACAAGCFRASTWTPSCVACAGTIGRNGYTSAYDFDVALTNNSTTADGTALYVSNSCRLRYCNTTGVLRAVAFCGAVYGCACCAGCATCARCILNSAGTTAYCIYIS